MKCKVKRDMKDEKRVRTKNGRSGISGTCTVCGGKIFRMVGGGPKATSKAKVPSK
jgi:DNA polymerase II large subunit